jgi:hypothetical protein
VVVVGGGGGAAEVCDGLGLDEELGVELGFDDGLLAGGVEEVEETAGESVAVGAVTAPVLTELGESLAPDPAVELDVTGGVATLSPEPLWVTA